jgi:hypothetical protein
MPTSRLGCKTYLSNSQMLPVTSNKENIIKAKSIYRPVKNEHLKKYFRHSGEGRNPVLSINWTPTFAGVTKFLALTYRPHAR